MAPTSDPTADLPKSFYCTKPVDFSKSIDTSNLKDKSVIITGGANGIGLACAKVMAEAGAYVSILDINEEKGSAVAKDLKDKGLHVHFHPCDVTSYTSQLTAFKSALSFSPTKTIDLVLAGAGIGGGSLKTWLDSAISSGTEDPSPPTTKILDINLTGVYYTTHLAMFYFKKTATDAANQASKQLIFISSICGYIPISNVADYNASKFGVRGLWKVLRHSKSILGPNTPFRTNLIAPTFIKTDLTAQISDGLLAGGFEMGEAEDVVDGIMRIACDESIYGRAICIAARKERVGDRNFDLCDDWEGMDAGREFLGMIREGRLRNLEVLGVDMQLV